MKPTSFNDGYCVLLCAHNGSAYLAEQLNSIARQEPSPARIVFFDDASTDETHAVAHCFVGVLPIIFVQLEKRRDGAAGAFEAILLYAAESPESFATYFLCDQDDIWESCKAARLIECLAQAPIGRPVLVHSELKCFGDAVAGREYLHQSLGHTRGDSTPEQPLQNLLFENVVVGASTAFNHTLLQCAMPMPLSAFMHDWWLAIACVAHGGEIRYLPEALTRYRIHSKSTVGRAGSFLHALPHRLKALRRSTADPWLHVVKEQLNGLPFGTETLPARFFEPLVSKSLALFRQPSRGLRFKAWLSLRKRRVWSVGSKDAYYKTRLFTDYVIWCTPCH